AAGQAGRRAGDDGTPDRLGSRPSEGIAPHAARESRGDRSVVAPILQRYHCGGKAGNVGRFEQEEQVLRTGRLQRGDRSVDGLGAGVQIVFVGQLDEDVAEEGLGVPFRQVNMHDEDDLLAEKRGNGRDLRAGGLFGYRRGDGKQQSRWNRKKHEGSPSIKEWVDYLESFS